MLFGIQRDLGQRPSMTEPAQAIPAEDRITVQLAYEGVEDLAVDLQGYVIATSGKLLDMQPVWFRRAHLALAPEQLADALFFVGPTQDVSGQGLCQFGLFDPFGFYEAVVTGDAGAEALCLGPIPESVWRRWLEDARNLTARNDLLWNSGGMLVPTRR